MPNSKINIVLVHNAAINVYDNYSGNDDLNILDPASESSVVDNIITIAGSIKQSFPNLSIVEVDDDISKAFNLIKLHSPDVVVNFVESIGGLASHEAHFASLLELMNIPYTGNSPETLCLCLNKYASKSLLSSNNISTPRFALIRYENISSIESIATNLKFLLLLNWLTKMQVLVYLKNRLPST